MNINGKYNQIKHNENCMYKNVLAKNWQNQIFLIKFISEKFDLE